jgi:arginyl-tRNA synthetase
MIKEDLEKILGFTVEATENSDLGDYSSNVALGHKPPREYAQKVVKKLSADKDLSKLVDRIEVAGPGFINFWLEKDVLVDNLIQIGKEKEKYGESNIGKDKTVVIDYSSPNIAKSFGIGHLRSTIIGQALYNLYKALGYEVVGDNHLGDWGTQFGVLLYQITSKDLDPEKLSIEELEKLYVEFHQEEEKDPPLHEKAKEWFKKLEEKDPEARRIWKILIEASVKEFDRIYDLLGIKIDYVYGESFYEDYMPQVIKELRKKSLLTKSEGAEIVELPNSTPAMIVKSDGTTTYFTRDLATIKFRISSWNPDLFIYEVGNDQSFYFRQLFAVVGLLGWGKGKKFVHVNHGLIRFEHGKMSTRKGQTIKLEEVLNEAIERAKKLQKEGEKPASAEATARQVGIGAVIYFDLSHHPTSDIIFDWEKMFVLEGNSAPYLQYTVARTNSVLAKSTNKQIYKSANKWQMENGKWRINDEELAVLRSLIKFSDVIEMSAKLYSPNLLCNYLYNLASKFNTFYNKYRILGGEAENFRLSLTSATGQVLKNGLKILGIQAPERM